MKKKIKDEKVNTTEYVEIYEGLFKKIDKKFKRVDSRAFKRISALKKINRIELKQIGNKNILKKIYLGSIKLALKSKVKLYSIRNKQNMKSIRKCEKNLNKQYLKQSKEETENIKLKNTDRGMTYDEIRQSQIKLGFITESEKEAKKKTVKEKILQRKLRLFRKNEEAKKKIEEENVSQKRLRLFRKTKAA